MLMIFLFAIPLRQLLVSFCCLLIWAIFWGILWLSNRRPSYYFDAQDFAKIEKGGGRSLPISASTGTFAPLLGHYIGVTQLLVTIAAASIAFGGAQPNVRGVANAK